MKEKIVNVIRKSDRMIVVRVLLEDRMHGGYELGERNGTKERILEFESAFK